MNIENDTLASAWIYYCIIICNVLSILACVCVFFVFCIAKNLRVYAFKLVGVLCIFDAFKSVSALLPTYNSSSTEVFCQFQAVSYQFFTLCSFLMTLLMSTSVYLCVLSDFQNLDKYRNLFIVFIVLIASLLTFPLIALNGYGTTNSWCWIKPDRYVLRMIVFFGPLWIVNLCNFYFYWKVINKLRTENCPLSRIRSFPFILVVSYLPFTIYRLLEVTGDHSPEFLLFISLVGDGLNGLVNSIFYGLTEHVKDYIKQQLCDKNSGRNLMDLNSFYYYESK